MKKRRTEKTVRRSFIYMGKASKIAVKQRQQRKKAPKNRCFFWQGQKDLNPRHAVLERKARFQLSRVSKYSPPQIPHKNSTFRI